MAGDKGAKYGWIFGGLGGLLFFAILSVMLTIQGKYIPAVASGISFIAGVAYLLIFRPWKFSSTQIRLIYLGLVVIILIGTAATILLWAGDQLWQIQNISCLPVFFVFFTPVFTFGKKTWQDLHKS